MSYVGQSLADGQVAGSKGTIYKVPTTKRAIVKSFSVFNTNTTSETVKAYIKRSGSTSRQIGIAVLAQDESMTFITDGEAIILSGDDEIEAETTTASFVDYVVTGALE